MEQTLTFVTGRALDRLPAPADPAQALVEWERWRQAAAATADAALGHDMIMAADMPVSQRWLNAIFGNSPYLTRLALREPAVINAVLARGPDDTLAEALETLNREKAGETRIEVMSRLRRVKRQVALIVGMADIAGLWPLARVTGALSLLADRALSVALRHLLVQAAALGQISLAHADEPERESGVIVLGMGKLGAHELNYSSDIDLIILFDADIVQYTGRDSVQSLMARLARDLVKLLEERTGDGYVFRTDLRLRPDPASTPPAVSVAAAEGYYGSLGQNWERAAMIKARPVAGDLVAGRAFLRALTPFIWRKHLDFAAIRDIHSIKRQIDARHGGSVETIAGHNVKLGHGGIREIEFFAQTQQLIWGGRIPNLRRSGTIETLDGLVEAGRIERSVADDLKSAYGLLRQVEHRLQMIDDAQTHTLPTDPVALRRVAIFLGYPDEQAFAAALGAELGRVTRHFSRLFRNAPALSNQGNLVFTGSENDPETLANLTRMGFTKPETVAEAIRGWHHGRLRATRSVRARELMNDLVPALLRILAKTADPDFAFTRFDEFLGRLPAGVQLFSLFQHHPELLGLVADIMGEAPHLAVQLARKPLLLDAVLTGDFFAVLSADDAEALAELTRDLDLATARARDYQDVLDLTRRWASDRKFRLGVQLIQGRIDGQQAGRGFSLIAEVVIAYLLPQVETEFARLHGRVQGGEFVVLALGKLGSRELTGISDIDLIFVYRADAEAEGSDGTKSLAVTAYFARLGQRLINALMAQSPEGNLYEVDMRLRPSGAAGPIASSLEAFRRYHDEQAWTWERQALTRARVMCGAPALGTAVMQAVREVLTRPRDPDKLLRDVAEMRQRVAKQHPKPLPWDCKHRRGGLIDIEFIAQYLQLRHAPEDPAILSPQTIAAFRRLVDAGKLSADMGATLIETLTFWHRLQGVLRIAMGQPTASETRSALLDRVLARATGIQDPDERIARIDNAAARALACYEHLIASPAAALLPPGTPPTEVPVP